MKITKLTLSMLLIIVVVLTCALVGCGSKKLEVWGKTFTYQGLWWESYQNFPEAYQDNYASFIDDNWDNIDWDNFHIKNSNMDFKPNKADYKDAQALIDAIGEAYAEAVKVVAKDAKFTFNKEGENMTAQVINFNGEEQNYKIVIDEWENYDFYPIADDGTVIETDMIELSLYRETFYKVTGLQIQGAETVLEVKIPLLTEIQGYAEMTNVIEISFNATWSLAE